MGTIPLSRVRGNMYGYRFPLIYSGNGSTEIKIGVAVDLFSKL
jgi:hypothetical protein